MTTTFHDYDAAFCYGTGRNFDCDNKIPHTPHFLDANNPFDVQKLSLIHRARHYKNRLMTYVDDYAVEIQTVIVVLAGVVLTDRVVRSNQSVKKELRFVKNSIDEIGMDMHFDRDEAHYRRDSARHNITEAHRHGEKFEYYPGLGVFFPGDVRKEK